MKADTLIFEYAGRLFSLELKYLRAILNAGSFYHIGIKVSEISDTLKIERKEYPIFNFQEYFNAADSKITENSRIIITENFFNDGVLVVDKIREVILHHDDEEASLQFTVSRKVGPITEYESSIHINSNNLRKYKNRESKFVRKVRNESLDS